MLPPPTAGLQVVSIDSLEAALAKMDIKVSMEDILLVIREVEEAKRAQLVAQAANRCATLSNRKSPAAALLLPFSILSLTPLIS
jgi:hypothetical protein